MGRPRDHARSRAHRRLHRSARSFWPDHLHVGIGNSKLSAASAAGSAPHAARGGCRRPRRTWSTTSSPMCRCVSGCCRCRSAAPAAGRAAEAGDAGAAGRAPRHHALAARSGRAQGRRGRQRRGHADPALWFGRQPEHPPALPGAGWRLPARTEGEPVFVEVPAPTDEALQALLHKIIARLDEAAHPSGRARRRAGLDIPGRCDAESDNARTLRPLQAAACTYRIASARVPGRRC